MVVEKMFIKAIRNKMRFPHNGRISVEDLWDLTPDKLDVIYSKLSSQVDDTNKNSFLKKNTTANKKIEEQLEILKYVMTTKIEEEETAKELMAKKVREIKLLEVLKSKQDSKYDDMTAEQIQELIESGNY